MNRFEIDETVCCDAEPNPETDVLVEYDKAKHASDKAVLIEIDEEDFWLPYSQIVDWRPEENSVEITEWIAEQKGLA